ncbi:exported hypothetical protein [Erythrobacter sp. EC-HK427]|nr:exported hypothetical protein [Erythrobacter sp. EC-HK427]
MVCASAGALIMVAASHSPHAADFPCIRSSTLMTLLVRVIVDARLGNPVYGHTGAMALPLTKSLASVAPCPGQVTTTLAEAVIRADNSLLH